MKPLAWVVAVAQNNVIGRDGRLPWGQPRDGLRFLRVTSGHAVVMGRKTFESIGAPLRSRRNIVVSRSGFTAPGIEVFTDIESAIAAARETDECPRVIGGAEVYAATAALVTEVYRTDIDEEFDGDTYLPSPEGQWSEVYRCAGVRAGLTFVGLERVQ